MNQYKAWLDEYLHIKGIPTTTRTTPSSALINFLNYCQTHHLNLGPKVLDLGCGPGRNSLYLAQAGFQVTAVDFIEQPLQQLKNQAQKLKLSNITILKADLGQKLPLKTTTYDWAIDIVTTVSLDNAQLKTFEAQLYRVLKPGALFLTYVHNRSDQYLKDRIDSDGFYTVPTSGLRERAFSQDQLLNLYSRWRPLIIKRKTFKDYFYNQVYTRSLWWIIFQKP